ncbi:hypothetical protein NW752_002492 [Fusarium irregulare]|uniref:Uncharacterized protein n=1 Tax=Fusarium irregulare TaxID=2494466 RepID=A0A9W8U4N8_9HYPO|nr:hypothetical protein NW766_012812 [Fusarium irregulare]KAJ4025033.1 hypothetical protein NW752_002492 [Fusarium irregulare]
MEPRIKFGEVRWNAGSTVDPTNGEESTSPKSIPTSQLPSQSTPAWTAGRTLDPSVRDDGISPRSAPVSQLRLPSTSAWNAGRTLDPPNRDDGISTRSVPISQLPLPPTAPPEKPFQAPDKPQTSTSPRRKASLWEGERVLNDRGKPWDALDPDNPIIGDMASLHLWGSSNVRRRVDQNVRQFPWGPTQSFPIQPASGHQYDFNSSPSGYGNSVPNPALPPSHVYAGAGYLPRFESANPAPQFNYPTPNPSFNAPDVGDNTLTFPSWDQAVIQPTDMMHPSDMVQPSDMQLSDMQPSDMQPSDMQPSDMMKPSDGQHETS